MASFSVKSFERKLKEMSARQDSVQTVSLWLIHHRAHSKTVVNLWLDRMKKAKPDRRLVLFYLANDIIQNSRKKGKEFSQSFRHVLGDSMQYLRDTSIRPSVDRVLKIWQERKVFDKAVVQKLLDELNNVQSKPKPKPKPKPETSVAPKKETDDKVEKKKKQKRPVPPNFKTINVTRAIATMQGIEDETERRQTLVKQMRLDASSSEGIKQLKDYAGGNRFSLEFEESSTKYEDLVQSLERESQQRQVLINLLEDGDAYYAAALKEASIIANAYRSFGNRLHSMKKKLDNKIRKFATAEKEAPVSAPKASFLSSGLSGILESMNQSPDGTPSRSDQETKEAEKTEDKKDENQAQDETGGKVADPTMDHVEVSDMDIDSDSENGGKDSEPCAAPQLSDSNSTTSAMSTPQPVLSTATSSALMSSSTPVLNTQPKAPVQSTSAQFGYTMTVNSTDETETSSPASHNSAPSPDGSPDLNLEIYEGPPATNTLSGVMTNQSFISGDEKASTASPQPQSTMNLLAHLISKQRRNNDGSSCEGTPERSSNMPVGNEVHESPLQKLFGNWYTSVPSQNIPGSTALQQEESKFEEKPEEGVSQAASNIEPSADVDSGLVDSKQKDPAQAAASKPDSGPSTDEEGAAGDNTPEHGLEFDQAPPFIFRSDASFPHPPLPPSFPGQGFQNRALVGRPTFMAHEGMPRFANEPSMFMRDGPRRPSIEEQLMEEQPLHEIRSPRLRSPRMQGTPMEWEHRPPFGPRRNFPPANNLDESRDPRLRRREQIMARAEQGPSFVDRAPSIEMRGRPPGMELRGVAQLEERFMERRLPVDVREELRRNEMELLQREEMMRRRLSLGDEIDGHPSMQMRPELHPVEGGPPMDMRERFHPLDPHHMDRPMDMREVPHSELRDDPAHIARGEVVPPMHIPLHHNRPSGPSVDGNGPNSLEGRSEFHPPPEMQDGPPDEVPTSEEESRDGTTGDPSAPVPAQVQGPGKTYFPEGETEELHPQMGNSEDNSYYNEFNEEKALPSEFQYEQQSEPMFHPRPRVRHPVSDKRSVFEARPGFHMDEPSQVGFGRSRPIRPIRGHFRPRHGPVGRFPGPRDFRPRNFAPRDFRPRFPPMHRGGPRLKRSGPPFHHDPTKRPHY